MPPCVWLRLLRGLCLIALCGALASCSLFSDGNLRKMGRAGTQGATQALAEDPERLRLLVRELLLKDDMLDRIAGRITQGVVGRLSEDEQKLRVAALVAAMTDALREHGDPVVAQLLKTAGGQLEQTLDHIAQRSLSRADELIRRLLLKDLVEASEQLIRRNADVSAQVITEKLRGELGAALRHTTGEVTDRVIAEALRSLGREENQEALRALVRVTTREVILGMGDGLKQELRSQPTQAALMAAAAVLLLLLIGSFGALWFYVRQNRTSAKVLAIISQKINESPAGSADLKRAIQQGAQRNQVEGWLSDFLKRRGL